MSPRLKAIVSVLVIALVLTAVVSAADIVLTITISDANGKAAETFDAFCKQYGWTVTVVDPNDKTKTIPNPVARLAFAKPTLQKFIFESAKSWRVQKKAQDAAKAEADAADTEIIFK